MPPWAHGQVIQHFKQGICVHMGKMYDPMEVYTRHSKVSFEFRSKVIKEILLKENKEKNSNNDHLLSVFSGYLAIMSIL